MICIMAFGIELLQLIISVVTKYAYSVCFTDDFLLMVLGAGTALLLADLITKRRNAFRETYEKER